MDNCLSYHHHHNQLKREKEDSNKTDEPTTVQRPKLPIATTNLQLIPSPTSSPSHEFSFTISLHPSPPRTTTPSNFTTRFTNKSSQYTSFAIDLAPADDIFFHGHLLPLHLLSHPPPPPPPIISPRSSNSAEITKTPPQEEVTNQKPTITDDDSNSNSDTKERIKTKTLSSIFSRWRRGSDEDEKRKKKNKLFDVSRLLKMMETFLYFRGGGGGGGRRDRRDDLRRRPYSFSGNPNTKVAVAGKDQDYYWRRRRGELSAPASMRTSPTNSGLLLATPAGVGPTGKSLSSDESTMEELQSAIQAAIAHCKNSIAVKEEEKVSSTCKSVP